MLETMESSGLFENGKVFKAQEEKAKQREAIEEVQKFLGFKLIDTCSSCHYQDEGKCHVMGKYDSKLVFDVSILNKCKHFKRGIK